MFFQIKKETKKQKIIYRTVKDTCMNVEICKEQGILII